ncbi:MAG: hypothetical protein ABR953_10015 [Candidatus Acidiferrales bacterium]
MALSRMRVMRRGLVVACLVVPGGLAMMPGRVVVMFRCLMVVLCRLLGHASW